MYEIRIILAAGGTGGHIWPALSLARALETPAQFLFIGTGRPIEARMVDPEGFERKVLKTSGLKGQGPIGGLKAVYRCLASVFEARAIIKSFKPDLCFGVGGYVTVPVGLAAKSAGVPLVIHEQNSRPGLSNKVLGRLADKIMLGFEEAASAFPAGKSVYTGNPVRAEIAALSGRPYQTHRPLVISVTGGSQGASGLNRLAASALILLKKEGFDFQVFHQAGVQDEANVRSAYEEVGLSAEVVDFYQDMAAFYTRSDLVIGRAGAITIAELTSVGLPSVLVPLPTAADDHQSLNAARVAESGAALLKPERSTSPEDLAASLRELLSDQEGLKRMAAASAAMSRSGVDKEMARICLEVIGRVKSKP